MAASYSGSVELQKLKYIVCEWVDKSIDSTTYPTSTIGFAFHQAGINGYNNLILCQTDDIKNLQDCAASTCVPVVHKHRLTAIVAFHHKLSHRIKEVFDTWTLEPSVYDDCIARSYKPKKMILISPEAVELTQLSQWRKNIKPSLYD